MPSIDDDIGVCSGYMFMPDQMIEHSFARTSVITRLRHGPLGAHLDTLATTLHQHRYAPDSIRRTLRACDQFGWWLAQHGYAIAEVDEALVERYLGPTALKL